MPQHHIVKSSTIVESARTAQLRGMFDLAAEHGREVSWDVSIPVGEKPWNIGLIVGPSGCGKTTIAREMFGDKICNGFAWSPDKSIVDDFPKDASIKTIVGALSSVGFSSPPAWLRPFHVLSNGEQFRVTMARAMVESRDVVVVDEFTSVVDRRVAQIGSAAIAKSVRAGGKKFIAVACHYDIIEWLQPDWIYQPATNDFQWRLLQRRPEIKLQVHRASRSSWELFRKHHYLDLNLHKAAKCFVGTIDGEPAAFNAVLPFPHPTAPSWRASRTVCLPDFQGVGIGNAMCETVASIYKATGKRFTSCTSHPAMIAHRMRSPKWKVLREFSFVAKPGKTSTTNKCVGGHGANGKTSERRLTAGFEYVGPAVEKSVMESFLRDP